MRVNAPVGDQGGHLEGKFINNYPDGYCISTEGDGSIYKGNCKISANSIYNGQGKKFFPDGSSFEGIFRDGFPNGKGSYLSPDGVLNTGTFINGEPSGDIKVTLSNGQTFIESY